MHGSDFNWGLGFAGVLPSAHAGVLPHASLIPDGLRESVARAESEKKS